MSDMAYYTFYYVTYDILKIFAPKTRFRFRIGIKLSQEKVCSPKRATNFIIKGTTLRNVNIEKELQNMKRYEFRGEVIRPPSFLKYQLL